MTKRHESRPPDDTPRSRRSLGRSDDRGDEMVNAILDVLAFPYCRYVLYALDEPSTDVLDIDDVAARVVAAEPTDRVPDPAEAKERAAITLSHLYLPLLDAAELVTYDVAAGRVHQTELPDVARHLLRACRERDLAVE